MDKMMKHIYKEKFKAAIFNRAEEIDPNSEYTWEALAVGFYIGEGVSIADAKELALETEL